MKRVNEFYDGLTYYFPVRDFWFKLTYSGKQSIPMGMVYYFDVELSTALANDGLDISSVVNHLKALIATNSPLTFTFKNGKLIAKVIDTNGVEVSLERDYRAYVDFRRMGYSEGDDVPYVVLKDGTSSSQTVAGYHEAACNSIAFDYESMPDFEFEKL